MSGQAIEEWNLGEVNFLASGFKRKKFSAVDFRKLLDLAGTGGPFHLKYRTRTDADFTLINADDLQ